MRKKYFQRSVTRRYLTKGVAPLIPLIISAVVLISTMAVSLFYTDDQKELRSRAASTTGCDVTLTASALPNSGSVPLNNVDLKANVGGTTTGTIEYQFNCVQGDNTWDKIVSTSVNPYTAVDLCNYSTSGSKTATVNVIRGGCSAFKTVSINVGTSAPTPTKTKTPTPPAACNVTLSASALPNSGSVPLNNVDLKANVGGTTTGTIEYQFNCVQGDNTCDKIVSTSVNPYTAVDLCNYSTSGSKTATVNVIRGGCSAFKTVSINVG